MAEKGIILGGKKIAKSSTSKLFGQITEQTLAKKEGINMLKFDTSPLVRTTFDKARMFGISADKFKKYTELDARIFMRPDRRVVLNFNALETLDKYKNFIIGIPKVFIRLTAENIATDKVIEKGKEFYLEYFDKEKVKQQKNISFEEYQSALWLSTATGQLNKAAETIEIEKKQEEE
jgi:hypothetical protein